MDEIKNVFNLLRIQLQKIQEAMLRVRRNALNYSVADYKVLLEENMETIDATKQKFKNYRETVKKRAAELEEQNSKSNPSKYIAFPSLERITLIIKSPIFLQSSYDIFL